MDIITVKKVDIPDLHCITLHWSGGNYVNYDNDYQVCIGYDINTHKAILHYTRYVANKGAHTWNRNTGNIGISLLSMANALEADRKTGRFYARAQVKNIAYRNNNISFADDLGTWYPPTPQQIEMMAAICAELSFICNIPLSKIHDHSYYCQIDNYEPKHYKWDIKPFMNDLIRSHKDKNGVATYEGKIPWYLSKLKNRERNFEYVKVV